MNPSTSKPLAITCDQIVQGTDSEFDVPMPLVTKKPRVLTDEEKRQRIAKRRVARAKYKKLVIRKKKDYPIILTRSNPTTLHDVVHRFNEQQRLAVEEMGFGQILNLNIRKLPRSLGYWLVYKFNHRSREIELKKGKNLLVTEGDVRRVYGFPNGGRRINQFMLSDPPRLYEEWRNIFGKKKVFLNDLVEEMLSRTDGGIWFRRHFLILVSTSLIHSHKNGQIFPYNFTNP